MKLFRYLLLLRKPKGAAEIDPWITVEQRYILGQTIPVTITKITSSGAITLVEYAVVGLIPANLLPPGMQAGQIIQARIAWIDPSIRRIGLEPTQNV